MSGVLKLLRTLQQREVAPVGGGLVPIDVRVIAATNADLQQRIEQGRFRRDLYYRIAGYVLQVPPLRERQGHIPRLVEDFIRLFSREVGKRIAGINVSALRALAAYHWPGNVRELEHEVRRLAYVCPEGQPIDVSMLSEHIRNVTPDRTQMTSVAVTTTLHLQSRVEQLERELIAEALRRSRGNRSEAARLLGISRGGLALKMERFGLRDGAPSGDHR